MNRLDAMTGLINHRLSKTVSNRPPPIRATVRGVPIYIGGDESGQQGATGILDTGVLSNVPDAIKQTNADVNTLLNEVFSAAYTIENGKTVVANSDAANFYINVLIPFYKDWGSFAYEHTHGWGKFKDNWIVLGGLSSWNSVNQYRQRVLDIRKSAEKFVNFQAPAPAGPSQNQLDYLVAGPIREIWKVVKWVVIIAIVAIGITIVLYGLPNLSVSKSIGSLAKSKGGRFL